jgi:aspartate/methionine/tyrosine aminotransferase
MRSNHQAVIIFDAAYSAVYHHSKYTPKVFMKLKGQKNAPLKLAVFLKMANFTGFKSRMVRDSSIP